MSDTIAATGDVERSFYGEPPRVYHLGAYLVEPNRTLGTWQVWRPLEIPGYGARRYCGDYDTARDAFRAAELAADVERLMGGKPNV